MVIVLTITFVVAKTMFHVSFEMSKRCFMCHLLCQSYRRTNKEKTLYFHNLFFFSREKPTLGQKQALEFLNPSEITVAFLTETEEVEPGSSIEEIIPHPEFSVNPLRHDIALLKLSRKLVCSQFRNPICLPLADLTVRRGEQFTVSGWGSEVSGSIGESRILCNIYYYIIILLKLIHNEIKREFQLIIFKILSCMLKDLSFFLIVD